MINKHARLKRYSRKQKKMILKPWITQGILTFIKKKRIMSKPYFIDGNETQKYLFKRYSNVLTKVKALSKKNYFKKEVDDHSSDPKKKHGKYCVSYSHPQANQPK